MFFWAFFICLIGIFLSSQLSGSISVDSGFMSVVFTIIPSTFFITYLIRREEQMEETYIKKHVNCSFWGRHEKYIMVLLFFFAGLTMAYAISYLVLPGGFFLSQVNKINDIIGVSGKVGETASGKVLFLKSIFYNNIKVMLFSFIFSFIFGAGAIFIITWNASILGVRIGQISRSLWEVPIKSLPFLPHGILEIAGYIAAGLAGGLLSTAIIRKNKPEVLKTIALDSIKVFLLAILLVFMGAIVEVYL
jgi:uncharacterized membrane protein SpoIIM required for sporulation